MQARAVLPPLQHGRSLVGIIISEISVFLCNPYCVARRKRLRRAGRSWGRSVGGISHLLGPWPSRAGLLRQLDPSDPTTRS